MAFDVTPNMYSCGYNREGVLPIRDNVREYDSIFPAMDYILSVIMDSEAFGNASEKEKSFINEELRDSLFIEMQGYNRSGYRMGGYEYWLERL